MERTERITRNAVMKTRRSFLTKLASLAAAIAIAPEIAFGRTLEMPHAEQQYQLVTRGINKCIYAKYATGQLIQITDHNGDILCEQFRDELLCRFLITPLQPFFSFKARD